jgi:hypothetical protein
MKRRRSVGLLLLAAAALIVVLGCGSSPHGTPGGVKPTLTLSLPGHPSAAVTDIRAFALTEDQASKIKQDCIKDAGIPGAGDECAADIKEVAQSVAQSCSDSNSSCRAEPCSSSGSPCPSTACPASSMCPESLYIGHITGSDHALVEVCSIHEGPGCGSGTLLPGAAIDRAVADVPGPSPSASASITLRPFPTPSSSPAPSPSYSPPAQFSSAPPPNSPGAGAGLSP